jgi:hypothetical protein
LYTNDRLGVKDGALGGRGRPGFLEHDETVRGMTTFAQEVYPRLKELLVTA